MGLQNKIHWKREWILLSILPNGILFSFIYVTQKLSGRCPPPRDLAQWNSTLLSWIHSWWKPRVPLRIPPLPVRSMLYPAMKQPSLFWVPLKKTYEPKSLYWWFWSRNGAMTLQGQELPAESSPGPRHGLCGPWLGFFTLLSSLSILLFVPAPFSSHFFPCLLISPLHL